MGTVTPPLYGKPSAIIKRRSSSSDIVPKGAGWVVPVSQAQAPPQEPPTCIEVRDCACQTRDSFLARLNLGKQYTRSRAPLALEEQSVVRRVNFPYFGYAASSASSETGRSLERLDEVSE
jgi:hypothetical protein